MTQDMTTLFMRWPTGQAPAAPLCAAPAGYRVARVTDWAAFIEVQNGIGFAVQEAHLTKLRDTLVPGSMHLCFWEETQEPVGVVVAERRDEETAEIAWVAVVVGHRGHRISRSLTAATTAYVLAQGHREVVLSTQAHRLAALKAYLDVGFEPVTDIEPERWEGVLRQWRG